MEPALGFRFAVTFLVDGYLPNPIDLRFARVSGLEAKVNTTTVKEGGQNLYSHRLPERIEYGNLILERGFVVGSPLNIELNLLFSTATYPTSNVIVTLLGPSGAPLSAWLFIKTYPVRWATSELDARKEEVTIDTIELAYTRMQALRI